jgi:methionine-rich copper-binding protein CopC
MRNGHRLALPLIVLLLLFTTSPLDAHAVLLSVAPAPNETVHGGAVHIQLRFNARIDARRSRLILVLPAGKELPLNMDQPLPDTLTSVVPKLVPGSYILRWQVLAVDGHITRGEVPFSAQ